MSSDISPESERFIQHAIETGLFQDRGSALDAAIDLLKRRTELLEHIDRGTQQLRSGQYADYDEEQLRRFFDEVQAQGQERYQASQGHP
jgi:Arc/MetJ-type ribon-helix-helix transcriptional regulator